MIHYGFGFLKRSLPGTIFQPIIYSGNALIDAELTIRLLSTMLLFAFFSVVPDNTMDTKKDVYFVISLDRNYIQIKEL